MGSTVLGVGYPRGSKTNEAAGSSATVRRALLASVSGTDSATVAPTAVAPTVRRYRNRNSVAEQLGTAVPHCAFQRGRIDPEGIEAYSFGFQLKGTGSPRVLVLRPYALASGGAGDAIKRKPEASAYGSWCYAGSTNPESGFRW